MMGRLTIEPSWIGGPDWSEPPPPPRCGSCGAFIPLTPDRSEHWEESLECDGTVDEYGCSDCGYRDAAHEPHREVIYAGTTTHVDCRRCGTTNTENL